ncbi:pentapeptide repeat-containing protein [Actinophytocola sp.]|uniref:pentapeptide repeat-containing protein n=1 Tax=Actinophytocola sp. TaxID=1872138 RepID=UPI002D80AF44|nr:pentapeptide repeat-containing protein [Actinophytocola sp.]HET9141003.1 pentapeptide repeat-containing protein [Actinophytocola sp.]
MDLVTSSSSEPVDRVLSSKAIWWSAAMLLLVAAGTAVWLLLAYGRSDADPDQVRNQLDAIKTAGTIVVGTGGAAALLLAARRQRTAERDHARQVQVDADTRLDATERRITELYTKAAEQLGSDKAPVRLAGLYALERLAQNNPTQRQTIVNVLCAYLRMPYQVPGEPPAHEHNESSQAAAHQQRAQEREVRLTAQGLLCDHVRTGADAKGVVSPFWADIDLDLTGAVLIDLDLVSCALRKATFTSAQFIGTARFDRARFAGAVRFDEARFDEGRYVAARFGGARFAGSARFDGAQFGSARFDGAQFASSVRFDGVRFADAAWFEGVRFADTAWFVGAEFASDAWFQNVHVAGASSFDEARFTSATSFVRAQFAGNAQFVGTQFPNTTTFEGARFRNGVPPTLSRFRLTTSSTPKADTAESTD